MSDEILRLKDEITSSQTASKESKKAELKKEVKP